MRLLAAIALLALAPAAAPWFPETRVVEIDDAPPPDQWQYRDSDVPTPVPVGYQRCVRIVWRDAEWAGRAITIYDPPIDAEQAALLNEIARRELALIEHCQESRA